MSIIRKVLLAAAVLLSAAGCAWEGPGWQRGVRTVDIEPGTGDAIITQYWTMGSRTTATFKRIPKGNTDRRGEERPEPPAPFAD